MTADKARPEPRRPARKAVLWDSVAPGVGTASQGPSVTQTPRCVRLVSLLMYHLHRVT